MVKTKIGSTLRGLESTTQILGFGGSDLFKKSQTMLDNWKHKNARDIVIVAILKEFLIPRTFVDVDIFSAFYVEKDEIKYLRPEFIKGIYNADRKTFRPNKNCFSNLNPEQQKKVVEDVKKHFMSYYAKYHHEIPTQNEQVQLSFSEKEIEKLTLMWYREQLLKINSRTVFYSNNSQEQEPEMNEDGDWLEDDWEKEEEIGRTR